MNCWLTYLCQSSCTCSLDYSFLSNSAEIVSTIWYLQHMSANKIKSQILKHSTKSRTVIFYTRYINEHKINACMLSNQLSNIHNALKFKSTLYSDAHTTSTNRNLMQGPAIVAAVQSSTESREVEMKRNEV